MNQPTNITINEKGFVITCPFFDNQRVKDLPDRKWVPIEKHWLAPFGKANAAAINNNFKSTEIQPEALAKIKEISHVTKTPTTNFPSDHRFKKFEPLSCQLEALDLAWPQSETALFMDMGTGKTFTTINLGAARYNEGQIEALIIICDTSVKPVWPEEIAECCPVPYAVHVHESGGNDTTKRFAHLDTPNLKIIIFGVESFSQGGAIDLAIEFADLNICMVAIDESISIKTPPKWVKGKYKPNRSSRCWDLGMQCEYRVILNGTPITQGIEDLFGQYRFLDWEIIGIKNYTSFRNRYCSMGGYQQRKIVGYNNVDELMEKIRPYTYIVGIKDVQDMPDQIWETRYVKPSPEQARMLKDLGDPYDMSTTMGSLEIDCDTVLERMTRYQQIVGGHFPFAEIEEDEKLYYDTVPIEGSNPKLDELDAEISRMDVNRKVIIWARFAPEQQLITNHLNDKYGQGSASLYQGTTEEKTAIIKDFQYGDCRFFIAGKRGYKGLTLTASYTAIYFSNSFSYGDREQSERRPWRIGQKNHVTYIDICMNHKIDKQIIKALQDKKSISEFVIEELKK